MRRIFALAFLAASVLPPAGAQTYIFTREQMLKYTAQNPFERFPDGRPKVPDELLEKLKDMSSEEILSIARRGYPNQYADGFRILNPSRQAMVGRAMTVQLMPLRPDIADVDQKEWAERNPEAAKMGLRLSHQTALDMLQKGDVFVVDAFGNSAAGGIVGDNLAYYIWKRTGVGFVIDGAIRDLQGIANFGMHGYFRDTVPPAINNVMVAGINVPVRIGKVTVLPGDVVFGDREGVFFIPPHLVAELVETAEITHIHDEWTKKKFDEDKYKSTDIYGSPKDPALIQEYEEYLKQRLGATKYEAYKKRQQSQRRAR
jgi:regulator of RNase E activity RraA